MVWKWSSARKTWPASWQTAAWCGNGLHGLSPLVDNATGHLRFDVARADVWSCGYAPRLPIAYIDVATVGNVTGGSMRQSLHDAVVEGELTTTAGAIAFRAFTSATSPVSVLELNATGGEAAQASLVPIAAVARLNPALSQDAFRNPPSSCRAVPTTPARGSGSGSGATPTPRPAAAAADAAADAVVCTQKLACDAAGTSGYSTALLRHASPASTRVGAGVGVARSTYFVSVGNTQPTSRMYPPTTAEDPTREALANVAAASASGPGALLAAHLRWWASFHANQSQGAFVTVRVMSRSITSPNRGQFNCARPSARTPSC